MSFNFNSDKETIRAGNPSIIGNTKTTIRSGTGSNEKEVMRIQLAPEGSADEFLPRVGINRTGTKVERIDVVSGGIGFTIEPTITVAPPPDGVDSRRALASAEIQDGIITRINIDDRGEGYTEAPAVTIEGGGGAGAVLEAVLDTIDFELDINGAIRTSQSIISDTARIINLDIDNLVTPDAQVKAPNLKTYINGTGTPWAANEIYTQANVYRYYNQNIYQIIETGKAGTSPPRFTDGIELNGTATLKHIGIREIVADEEKPYFGLTGEAGLFPRSITPPFGDRSDKIATTEYVLNLATNDVGGRIYVSSQIGNDLNDGRSAVTPVATIKRACQLAWETVGVKETVIIAGGDYTENNPISIPPDCSIVGDNLRLVIVRPANAEKHMFKFGDKNYVIGVTFRDAVTPTGVEIFKFDYAMVFDDRQRIVIDYEQNGDFGVNFPVGHSYPTSANATDPGAQRVRINFSLNTGGALLQSGQLVVDSTGTRVATVTSVSFDTTTGDDAYVDGSFEANIVSGSFQDSLTFSYFIPDGGTDPETGDPSGDTYGFSASTVKNITAEAEIVQTEYDALDDAVLGKTNLPIQRIDFSLQGTFNDGFQSDLYGNAEDLGGIVFYTNPLVLADNIHPFVEGQEVLIEGVPSPYEELNGRQRIYKVIEDADGRSRRFVIPKKFPTVTNDNFVPGVAGRVKSASRILNMTLLNSPNKYKASTPVARRYQDACIYIKNNRKFIADEVVGRINREFSKDYFSVYNINNIVGGGTEFDIYLGTSRFGHTYVAGGTITFDGIDYSVTDFQYDTGTTGIATITTSSQIASLAEDDIVKIAGIEVACSEGSKIYPSFNIPTSDEQCKQDIFHFLDALCRDLEFGSNYNIVEAAQKYIVGAKVTYIENEIIQTVRAIRYAEELATLAMRNWRTGTGLPGEAQYTPGYGASQLDMYFDDTVITATAGSPACANVASAINTLAELWTDVIANNTGAAALTSTPRPSINSNTTATQGTYLDAAYLIARNRDLIADLALRDTESTYPSLGLTDVQQRKCRRDINFVLSGLIRDLCIGGNSGIVAAAEEYFRNAAGNIGNQIEGIPATQIEETLYAFDRVSFYAQRVINNWTNGDVEAVTPLTATYNAADGAFSVTFPNLSALPSAGDRIAFAEGAISFTCTSDGNNAVLSHPRKSDPIYGKSVEILTVSSAGGNTTVTCNVGASPVGEQYAHTFDSALTDKTYIIYTPTDTSASPIPKYEDWNILVDSTNPLCNNVRSAVAIEMQTLADILDGSQEIIDLDNDRDLFTGNITSGSPNITGVANTDDLDIGDTVEILSNGGSVTLATGAVIIDIQGTLVVLDTNFGGTGGATSAGLRASSPTFGQEITVDIDILPGDIEKDFGPVFDPTTDVSLTYPDVFIRDANGQICAIRAVVDDLPIIEASPYTQNSSIISKLGANGAEVDGAKVKQPNCPRAGLKPDFSGEPITPNQGKSMVAAAFTIVSQGGTGYKIVNDGYTQLVSVFVIFCQDGVLAESGGYASITNSATNFGGAALRATGYRDEPYEFDIGIISGISTTLTGRTILIITGLGRTPIEHYIIKVPGYTNKRQGEGIEYFIDAVEQKQVDGGQCTIDNGSGDYYTIVRDSDGVEIAQGNLGSELLGKTVHLHRPSIVNSSSHTWEFAGAGNDYTKLPENGGQADRQLEQVDGPTEGYGRVYASGTDELGDFKVGDFAKIENRTGNISFTGTVSISEVEFLKLKGGDTVVTGFDASPTLGGLDSSNSKLPTQKAVKDYITNNLGQFIGKRLVTNSFPGGVVQLTDSGKIALDQIPALRPFSVYTVGDEDGRLALEGALAGDIAIQEDDKSSWILNNDTDSQFLGFDTVAYLSAQFTIGDLFLGSLSGGLLQSTEYRIGVVYQITITDPGSGYTVPPTITITGGNPQPGGVPATAQCTIANGEVVTITITEFNGFTGGKGYTEPPNITFTSPPSGGTVANAEVFIESRLYGNIANNTKLTETDTFQSSDAIPETVQITRVVNTSAFDQNNWIALSSDTIDASAITSGVIDPQRLATDAGAANSFTFLRGDRSYAPVVQSLKGAETRFFGITSVQSGSGADVLLFNNLTGVTVGQGVSTAVSGIPVGTTVEASLLEDGTTTVTLSESLTSTIPAGTIIEFNRGESPILVDATYTEGDFIDKIIIANGGSGLTNGEYEDAFLLSTNTTGSGLKANITVENNTVTDITVTDGGAGYDGDFTITTIPPQLNTGGGGASMVLEAKVNTVSRKYANIDIDIARVATSAASNEFSSLGVARFDVVQFDVGVSGNGSIRLKTGQGSGLNADKLDNKEGIFYQTADNILFGTLDPDRLSGTYPISVSNQSGWSLRLISGTGNPGTNINPELASAGITANTLYNSTNNLYQDFRFKGPGGGALLDTDDFHVMLNIRKGDTTNFGGVTQLAFDNLNNMYIRGNGNNPANAFTSWGRVWTENTQGANTGMDSDRLDGRQGDWYRTGTFINYGQIWNTRLPEFQTQRKFLNSVTVASPSTDAPRYQILVLGQTLDEDPFINGQPVSLFNSANQNIGDITIASSALGGLIINNDDDPTNVYTIIRGTLSQGGTVVGAIEIGELGAGGVKYSISEITPWDNGTFEVAKLENSAGTGNLRLGRKDGVTTSPGIYFHSSENVANYHSAFIATGGSTTDESGSLDVKTLNADTFTIKGQKVWNDGNTKFSTTVGNGSTFDGDGNVTLRNVPLRDAIGNFQVGQITTNRTDNVAVVGSASLNVLKSGDTMSGSLSFTNGGYIDVEADSLFQAALTVDGSLTVDSGTLFVDSTNNRVGINELTPDKPLHVVGAISRSILKLEDSSSLWSTNGGNIAATPLDQAGIEFWGLDGSDTTTKLRSKITTRVSGTNLNQGQLVFSTANTQAGTMTQWMRLDHRGYLGLNVADADSVDARLHVEGSTKLEGTLNVDTSITISDASGNSGAPLLFLGSSGYRNFRIGNNLQDNDVFEIGASDSDGGQAWKTTPAIAIQGTNNRVAINTDQFSGTDPDDGVTLRNYSLNIQGDININGLVFQNNAEFVTSRWTESPNEIDIYRQSKVGIGFTSDVDPSYELEVEGAIGMSGKLYVNDVAQWIDSGGIIKVSGNTIAEDITIPGGTNAFTIGNVNINSGYTITVNSGATWNIL